MNIKKGLYLGVVLFLILFQSLPLRAVEIKFDGNELLSNCQQTIRFGDGKSYDEASNVYCLGIIHGVYTTMRIFGKTECIPGKITTGQTARITVKYLNNNPKHLHQLDAALIIAALLDAYPCKK